MNTEEHIILVAVAIRVYVSLRGKLEVQFKGRIEIRPSEDLPRKKRKRKK